MKRFPSLFRWSTHQWVIFLSFLFAFIIVPLSFKENAVNNALLWLTGVVVLFYTVETQGLRLEMVRQNEMAVQPLVIVGIEQREIGDIPAPRFDNVLVFRNIGRGPALFVKPKDIHYTQEDDVTCTAKFEPIDFVEPGKDATATVNLHIEGKDVQRPVGAVEHLDPRYANTRYEVVVEYQDINGQKRESVMQMGKGGIRLLKHGKCELAAPRG